MRSETLCVLHLALPDDTQVLDSIARTTTVIGSLGIRQIVMLPEDGAAPAELRALLPLAALKPVPCSGLPPWGQVRVLLEASRKFACDQDLYALHLHGVWPCAMGAALLQDVKPSARVLCSPHLWSTTRRPSWASVLVSRLLRHQAAMLEQPPLAESLVEVQALSRLLNRCPDLVPRPVSGAYFHIPRREPVKPSVVADGSAPDAVDLFTRLAVLLDGGERSVRFTWLGRTDDRTGAQLRAADVELTDPAGDEGRAKILSQAAAFVHVAAPAVLPHATAQAMAAGVPCLASDTAAHRGLIRHGETGFICSSERDFIEKMLLLLRDRAEAQRIGRAARAEAARRFTFDKFRQSMLRAYGLAEAATQRAALPLLSASREAPHE